MDRLFIDILQMKEYYLHNYLVKLLKSYDYDIVGNENYIYANIEDSTNDICVLAHLDTVWPLPPRDDEMFYDAEKDVLIGLDGLGADDRAGVYIIVKLLELGHRPRGIVFTHDEEYGGIGARYLVSDFNKPVYNYQYLIQLDRQGVDDCVFYQCNNTKFEEYVNTFGWVTAKGTMSDISIIAPAWNIAAVNLSTGYFDEHMSEERVKPCYICDVIIPRIEKMFADSEHSMYYRYVKKERTFNANKSASFSSIPFLDNKDCYYCGRALKDDIYLMETDLYYYICPHCMEKHHSSQNQNIEMFKNF